MKKLIIIALIAFSAVACTHQPGNGGSKDPTNITIIEIRNGNDKNICWYRAQTENAAYVGQTLWFNDTIGKYKVGDILNK